MDVVEDCLTEIIKSDNFPAKLWRLVNNPVNEAIFWDKDGLVVVIDQILFEQQVLFPRNSSSASNNADTFQTANFSSFLRNLNLYGFKQSNTYDDVKYRYYYHPDFKRDHPELVASLVRLTVVNKAKLEAGLKVKPWTLRRYHRYSGGCGGRDKDGQIGNHSLPSTPHRKSAHPYCPNKAPVVTAHNGTPVPPRFLTLDRGAALSPAVFATDKGIPVMLSQHNAGAASSSNDFPAKLWRLVNNPVNEAIFWDKDGLVVVIDQILFEQQVLFPRNSSSASNNADTFQTANFSSFLRNLNLYGFKKSNTYDDVKYRYYYHPNFKRDHPELVASLVRLTVANKAKLEAGLKVKPWTPRRYHRYSRGCGSGDKDGQIGNHSLPSTPHRKSAHPYCPNKAPAVTAHNGTPVPPPFLTLDRGAALSPAVFATDKGIPVTLSQDYAGAASSSNAMLIQQSLLPRSNHGNPNFTDQPGSYMPGYQSYNPNLVASQMAGDGLQKGSYPTDSHYQASCPVNVLSHVDRNQDSKNKEHQQVEECDINFDTIFQIADELMQTLANSSLARVVDEDTGNIDGEAEDTSSTSTGRAPKILFNI